MPNTSAQRPRWPCYPCATRRPHDDHAYCSNAQIGRRLAISRRTAEHHVQHIYRKLGVSSRAAVALFAMEHDLLAPGG